LFAFIESFVCQEKIHFRSSNMSREEAMKSLEALVESWSSLNDFMEFLRSGTALAAMCGKIQAVVMFHTHALYQQKLAWEAKKVQWSLKSDQSVIKDVNKDLSTKSKDPSAVTKDSSSKTKNFSPQPNNPSPLPQDQQVKAKNTASSSKDPATLTKMIEDISTAVTKSTDMFNKFNRLWAESEVLFNERTLKKEFPRTWRSCNGVPDSDAVESDGQPSTPSSSGSSNRRITWPILFDTPLEDLVAFGRSVLREFVDKEKIPFVPISI